MFVTGRIVDNGVIVGEEFLKVGTVLQEDTNGYKALQEDGTPSVVLLQDTMPTLEGKNAPILVAGIVEKATELVLPVGLTAKEIKPTLRSVGIYIRGV